MRRVLDNHPINAARREAGLNPANVVLLRGCGCRIKVAPFSERHGLRACLVAPTKIIAGMGMSLGVDALEAPGATGSYDSDLASKAAVACGALISGGYDFALLHVKAVDDAGHDRLAGAKVRFLEAADAMVGRCLARLAAAEAEAAASSGADGGGGGAGDRWPEGGFAVCVTGDHSTPVVFGDHSHEPVPFSVARVRDAVAALGGAARLAPADAKVAMPDAKAPPSADELRAQAALKEERRRAAAAAEAGTADDDGGGAGGVVWPPRLVLGDAVAAFDELSAARGALGRFPGSEAMPLLKRFIGLEAAGERAAAE